MTSWIPPWDENYPQHGNPVPSGAHVPWAKPQAPTLEPITPDAVPAPILPRNLEDLIRATLEEAAREVMPKIQGAFKDVVIKEVTGIAEENPAPEPPELDLSVLTHADARGAALRSLFLGVSMSALAGLATGVSAAAGMNWFTKDGAIGAVSILGYAVLHSVMTYAGHLRWGSPSPRSKSLHALKG